MISLPIDAHLDELRELIAEKSVVILSSSPGSGKTTRVPSALRSVIDGKIMILEPRRIAATMAATRIADENGWKLGAQVGYQVRFENQSSASTEILFVTEALLIRKLINDPTLKEYGLIILDEFHERSIHSDTALAMLKELQELERPDLKILIMSATLDLGRLQQIWPQAGLIDVEIPIHPLTVKQDRQGQTLRPGPDLTDKVVERVKTAWKESPGGGDLLVFLPGKGEMDRVFEKLEPMVAKWPADLRRLHGSLTLAEQRQVLTKNPNVRRIILSTNVAESSLTVDGVDTVVDAGLERISNLHHRTGFQSLELVRASKSSARQRAGRAARQGPGLCLQMWAPSDELSMPTERLPEIHRTDLTDLTLLLVGLGVKHPASLPWIDAPSVTRWKESFALLLQLGAVTADHALTDKGRKMLGQPLPARWSSLVVESEKLKLGSLGAELSALIQAQIPINDLEELWDQWQSRGESDPKFSMAKRIFQQIGGASSNQDFSDQDLTVLLWTTFQDRLARVRSGQEGAAMMTGERAVALPRGVRLRKSPFFFALDLMEASNRETIATQYLEIPEAFIQKTVVPAAKESEEVIFDSKTNRIWKRRQLSFEGCPLGEPVLLPAPAEAAQEALGKWGLQNFEEIAERNESLREWILRLRHFDRKKNTRNWPFSEEALQQSLYWAAQSEKGSQFFFEKNLTPFFELQMDSGVVSEFHRACPEFLKSPKGRQLKVEYREGIAPLVALRIQDAFGWPESPQILGEPIVTDLLAPNGRPQQRTQDLKNFWKSSYLDVRKDLRARYPKHAWPEDPMKPPEED